MLADAEIAAIYVTPWQRNRQTALPLATRIGVPLTVIDSIDSTVVALRGHPGRTVLVVGHSNTVPQIVAALGGREFPPYTEADFDRLYVVTFGPGRAPQALYLHYGALRP